MDRNFVVPYSGIGTIFGDEEIRAVVETLRTAKTLSCGPQRQLFEREFAMFVGCKYAFALTSCTVALEFATYLIGLHPGDEVIATPFTYQATIQPLLNLPVAVRFCDIDRQTLGIDPAKLEALITSKTRAIYLTHYAGLTVDMDPVMEIAERHKLIVVEDCAHAHGSSYKGRIAGSLAHIGCFSFQSMKNMSTLGQGGMITFSNDSWANTIRKIRATEPDAQFAARSGIRFGSYDTPASNLNRHDKNAYSEDCVAITHPGTNATLSEPAAAVGRVQLRNLPKLNQRRRAIANRLNDAFAEIPGVQIQRDIEGYGHSHHLYTLLIDPSTGLDREQIGAALEEFGIEIHLRYFPIHLLPEWRYRGHSFGECPTLETIWFEQLLNLPCYPALRDDQVDYMIDTFHRVIQTCRS